MANSITILIHPEDPYPNLKSHLIWYLVECWKEMGFEIEIIKGLPTQERQFELLLPHIDLTKVPRKYVRVMDRNPKVVNRRMTDISKRSFSRNLVSQNSAYAGPVIVKTNANYGGIPETQLRERKDIIRDKIHRMLRPKMVKSMNPHKYQVYDSKNDVPGITWKNRHLVVERFIPERNDDYYSIRVCFFLGDVILNHKVYSKSKVIKGSSIEFVEPIETHQDLIQIREKIGLDYGKFDYVIHGDEVHILDVNKTPGVVSSIELNIRIAKRLAPGIEKYL